MPGQITSTLISAGAMFVLAIVAGFAGWLLLFAILWGIGGLLVGVTVWQTRWVWRIARRLGWLE